MKSLMCLCTFLLFPILMGSRSFSLTQETTKSEKDFRYIICGNELRPRPGPNAVRNISVLMDENSFGPDTLKRLFRLLDERFPEPNAFICMAFTSLDQLNTPEEADQPKHSETNELAKEEHHNWAILMRGSGNEIIRYTAAPGLRPLITLVLKGTDPFSFAR